jgi:hypothetical protein
MYPSCNLIGVSHQNYNNSVKLYPKIFRVLTQRVDNKIAHVIFEKISINLVAPYPFPLHPRWLGWLQWVSVPNYYQLNHKNKLYYKFHYTKPENI